MIARPIVVIDTSVFLQDAFSKTRKGAASQLLTIVPVVAHVVMCDGIRDEIIEKLESTWAGRGRRCSPPTVPSFGSRSGPRRSR
ncbi:MAG: hypothetical protein Q8M74_07225, partial [Chloroflexota bacterium]|nr:hypothetical protein [Chloroflexota bacterium]